MNEIKIREPAELQKGQGDNWLIRMLDSWIASEATGIAVYCQHLVQRLGQ
jgi:hypothetical protein